MTKRRELSEMEVAFLDALMGEAKGDPGKAKKIAGYSQTTRVGTILKQLEEEILELTKGLLLSYGPKAALAYNDVLDDKAGMNAREKINTANQILDRIGLVKTEKIEVETNGNPVVLLPPKTTVDMDNLA